MMALVELANHPIARSNETQFRLSFRVHYRDPDTVFLVWTGSLRVA